ncbi:MAG TPA: hypothetical protein VMV41_01610 [Cellulomonadaceae bacterium]|nr:hypothetical protein [Cellulomonadaceae bacterium]
MSMIFEAALDEWRRVRDDYRLAVEAQLDAAESACAGVLLNQRGRAAGVDVQSLFSGPGSHMRARAYASDELLEFWRTHPRQTFAAFESQITEWVE